MAHGKRLPVFPHRWFLIALIGAAALAALFLLYPHAASSTAMTINGKDVTVEIADTPLRRARGLSGRPSLAPDRGMLFVHDAPGRYAYWMGGMKFPLDIVWIRDGEVVDVVTLQNPTASSAAIASYMPVADADRVLELNAGMAERLGLKPGVRVDLPL